MTAFDSLLAPRSHRPLLGLDDEMLMACRALAARAAAALKAELSGRTTVSIERASLRLIGVEGADAEGVPLVNRVVDRAVAEGVVGQGVVPYVIAPMAHEGLSATDAARFIVGSDKPWKASILDRPVLEVGRQEALHMVRRVRTRCRVRDELRGSLKVRSNLRYVIVATGDIRVDAEFAVAAAEQGADVIAIIRSTAQSLLDYVPEGLTFVGHGGTFATQANFRHVRAALDEVSKRTGRYVALTNYASGLCMPEIAAMAAVEGLDMMLNDALYGILFRAINPERTLLDQQFSRSLHALAGIVINTGEDNFLTTDDAETAGHTVLASQFLNDALAQACGLHPHQIGLGHAMEMDPEREGGLVWELAQAALIRSAFPDHTLKFMPPTRHKTGDLERALVQDVLFDLVASWTDQDIVLLGMHSEAMHTPHVADRALALRTADRVMRNASGLGSAVDFRADGEIAARAHQTLTQARVLLEEVSARGLFAVLADGRFARVRRPRDGGRGGPGVFHRAPEYWNPVWNAIHEELDIGAP